MVRVLISIFAGVANIYSVFVSKDICIYNIKFIFIRIIIGIFIKILFSIRVGYFSVNIQLNKIKSKYKIVRINVSYDESIF